MLLHCSEAPSGDDDDDKGKSGNTGMGGSSASGGSAGTPAAGGMMAKGGSSTGGSAGSAGSTGGSVMNGGTGGGTGGSVMNGGTGGGTGGSISAGGMGATGGSISTGGMGGSTGGSISTGGMAGMAGTGPITDAMGVPLAKPGDMKSGSRDFLNLGDMRLIANKWGSDKNGCNTTLTISAKQDKTLGWTINRGSCNPSHETPDYPEIEFGIHPFGAGSNLATSPSYSSTMILPKQLKEITSASVTIDNLNSSISASVWNTDFEMWISQKNPVTEANPGVYMEVMTFWGWNNDMNDWKCDASGSVNAGDKSYNLCHTSDNWGSDPNVKWRYRQFRMNGGPTNNFSGKLDVKPILDWLVQQAGVSSEMWVTRFEVGSEVDDNASGGVTIKNITFEVNGQSRSPMFAQ
jgi:hypothetical protein